MIDKYTDGSPIRALIGYNFKVNGQPLVVVSQIQSTRNFSVHYSLRPLRWERMLLRMITDFWFENGVETMAVQSAEANKYFNHPPIDRDRHLRTREEFQADLKRRYNGTARREGFRYDAIKNLFLLSNPNLSS